MQIKMLQRNMTLIIVGVLIMSLFYGRFLTKVYKLALVLTQPLEWPLIFIHIAICSFNLACTWKKKKKKKIHECRYVYVNSQVYEYEGSYK